MAEHNLNLQPIGELLLKKGLIEKKDIEKALAFQEQFKGRIGAILVRIGALSEDTLLPVLSEQLNIKYLTSSEIPTHDQLLKAISATNLNRNWLHDQKVVIWEDEGANIHAASRNPIDSGIQESIASALTNYKIIWHLARSQDIESMLRMLQKTEVDSIQDEVSLLRELAEEAPVVELVNNIIGQAIDDNASDIHLEPGEQIFTVRLRIDGLLHTRMSLPRARFSAIASRIKLIAGMDIAERRLPQDGRISTRAGGVELDIRVSCVPGVHGESIVMRLLAKERNDVSLVSLGMESDHLQQFLHWVQEPHGIILVTGPTGSGKSTTLYAGLEKVNNQTRKIITVEDPVEYQMHGVTQIQTQSDIGYTFARALRAILRQDPDIIMIGEIRDLETAEIAVQSALTGHMVLSTLHTNDAISSFSRLLDMGIEPFLIATAVRAVQAQRLVRKICAQCAEPFVPNQNLLDMVGNIQKRNPQVFDSQPFWRKAKGCKECRGTGYRGRLGIFEFLNVTHELQESIMRQDSVGEMMKIAQAQGHRSLREDGLIKARRGFTTIDEVLRVTGISNTTSEKDAM